MRILYHSVPARYNTGYGVQTKLFTRALKEAGHEVIISSVVGGLPNYHDENGILTLSEGLRRNMGNDFIQCHARTYKADIVLTMFDTFIADLDKFRKLPWVAWQVIDSSPIVPNVRPACEAAKVNLAMSLFGQTEMSRLDYDSVYMPLAYDSSEYYMMNDRQECRDKISSYMSVDLDGRFFLVMNSANMSCPSRKNFAAAFKAFRMFLDRHDDKALLYVHTEKTGQMAKGEDLREAVKLYGLEEGKNIIFADQYPYNMGQIDTKIMRTIYNAADVFLHTARGEGFGIPIVEAQACGCPVIVPRCTSMVELMVNGRFATEGIWYMYHPGTEQFVVDPEDVCRQIYELYNQPSGQRVPACEQYEINNVYDMHMKPLLEKIERGDIVV